MKKENDPNRTMAIVAISLMIGMVYVMIYCMIRELFSALGV